MNSHTPILLQTAKVVVRDAARPQAGPQLEVRAILDSGSQRSYVTARVCDALEAKTSRSERMVIKTFGSAHENSSVYNIVEVMLTATDGEALILPMVVVLHICDPVRTPPVDLSKARYEHLSRQFPD